MGIILFHTTPYWPQANGEIERFNRNLTKVVNVAQAAGSNWKDELFEFLLMYRSTAHATTNISPSELLFNRQIKDKLPSLRDFVPAEELRDRDFLKKSNGKIYADRRRGAISRDVSIGDTVLVGHSPGIGKGLMFEKEAGEVVDVAASEVTVWSPSRTVKRNIADVKVEATEEIPEPAPVEVRRSARAPKPVQWGPDFVTD